MSLFHNKRSGSQSHAEVYQHPKISILALSLIICQTQARDSDSTSRDSEGKLVGKFFEGGAFIPFFFISDCPENLCISVEGSKYLKCDGMDRATVTHTSREEKETITFK